MSKKGTFGGFHGAPIPATNSSVSTMRLSLLSLVLSLNLVNFPATATELEIIVTALASNRGDVHVAIYNTPELFPDSDGMTTKLEVPIEGNAARALFTGLMPGFYAIAVYHDENMNDEFDQGFLGIPLEDFAFSNGTKAFLGPPSFADAAVDVPLEGRRIEIPMTD
jgi:uncharacterized protein (DUF2141 family)